MMLGSANGVALLCLSAALAFAVPPAAGEDYSWQRPHAKVIETGDLEWAPEPFTFQAGQTVRYIDFEGGDDEADGLTGDTAWKHHPWDERAAGSAAAHAGPTTYVFRQGVVYRGELVADESGEPGDPIRLTRDPAWGEGEAAIYGSEAVTGWTRGADHPDIPEGETVWWADLDFVTRCVWMVDGKGTVTRLKLARTPNWRVTDPDEIKSEWWEWENPEWWRRNVHKTTVNGKKMHLGVDTQHLTESADHYEGAIVWTEYGIMMGTPFATRVEGYDPERRAVAFQGVWYGESGEIIRGNRYYLEDKPHYLDEPGEFWFEPRGNGGRLYVRLPGEADPNALTIEAGRLFNLVDSRGMSHVHVSGLTFRFTNVWDLPARGFVHEDVDCACVRMLGSGRDLRVTHCRFEHVNQAVRIKAVGDRDAVDEAVVADNEVLHTDHGAIEVANGNRWGKKDPPMGRLGHVAVLRNRLYRIGLRPIRSGHGHALTVGFPEVAEIAGNMLHRCYGAGLFIFGGKPSGYRGEAPLSRVLIHHNRVVDPLLNTNDWGGVETWQGGPYYVYDNVSGNPGGYMNWRHNPDRPGSARFAFAYYLDGSFKNYHFNNVAWGKNNDPSSRYCNTAAFQEIISYQNTIFNNTAYRFFNGSRRQAPQAGRDKFLANVWQDISGWVFWHAQPTEEEADPNVYQISEKEGEFAYETNAYARNVFHEVSGNVGVFESSGVPRPELEQMRGALQARRAMADEVGVMAPEPPLRDAAGHDFRPAPGSAVAEMGVKVFVPWSLYGMVGEWNFTRNNADPSVVIDEHWYMTRYHVGREEYYTRPTYPLRAVNVEPEDYVDGPLEDWTRTALSLDGEGQYLVLEDDTLDEPFRMEAGKKPEGAWAELTLPGQAVPGEPFNVDVKLTEPVQGQQVAVHLHWLKPAAFGGFNAWGGLPKSAETVGPHRFTFTPEDKPDLDSFSLLVYLSPTGDYADRTVVANVPLPKGEPGLEAEMQTVSIGEGEGSTLWVSVEGEALKNPEIHRSDLLLEVYFRAGPGSTGVLVEKMGQAGYSLTLGEDGAAAFAVRGGEAAAELRGRSALNDGAWHHLIAEADREAGTLALYVDGQLDAHGPGVGPEASLANGGDLHVGGTPDGRCLAGAIEFLRMAQGTLAEARTTIEELYEWQFNGPFLRDFAGRPRRFGRTAAGAIDHASPR